MIGRLKGTVVEKVLGNSAVIILDVQDVGYEIQVALQLYDSLYKDAKATVFIHHIQRDDSVLLFGFSSMADREFFRLLISVSGVGPKTAVLIVDRMGSENLQRAVAADDHTSFEQVPGVGKKTAQRIVIDLQGKLDGLLPSQQATTGAPQTVDEEVKRALEALGYNANEAQRKVRAALENIKGKPISAALLLRETLKN